jgi:hypothetical protein
VIRASQLDQAAAQLDGLAAQLGGAAERFAALQLSASEHAASLSASWGGPLPGAVDTAVASYVSQVDGRPAGDAVPVVHQWAAAARGFAVSARTLEQRRARTVNELVHTSAASVGVGPEADALAAERRSAPSADLSSIDRQVEELHQEWTRACSS